MLNQSFSYVYKFLIIKFNDNYIMCDSYSFFLYSNLDWEFNNKDMKYIFTLCHMFFVQFVYPLLLLTCHMCLIL